MLSKRKILLLLVTFVLFTWSVNAQATTMAVGETGNDRASATSVDSLFSLPAPGTVFGSLPTATVTSSISSPTDVDWYSFTGFAGASIYADIDDDPYTVDTVLSLFDSSGTLLAYDDDSWPLDPGSARTLDSFLGVFDLTENDIYYLAVSSYYNFPTERYYDSSQTLVRPDGAYGGQATPNAATGEDSFAGYGYSYGAYTLHITNSQPVPEPATFFLVGTGLVGLAGVGRKRFFKK
jgi:hypothetical protein